MITIKKTDAARKATELVIAARKVEGAERIALLKSAAEYYESAGQYGMVRWVRQWTD